MSEPTIEALGVADTSLDRRQFLSACTAAGLGPTLFPGALLALAATAEAQPATPTTATHPAGLDSTHLPPITDAMIEAASAIAGIALTPEQRAQLLPGVNQIRDSVEVIRTLHLQNATPPAFIFNPLPAGMVLDRLDPATTPKPILGPVPDITRIAQRMTAESNPDAAAETLAFATVRELAELLRTRRVTSTTLTRMYLARLKRLDPQLHCVIHLTEDRALASAAVADREIAAGKYRGPLHGIPWGAKDLFAVKGYPTTWGAAGFEDQSFDADAEVVQRLDRAGAVLIAKLSMGALAQGDLWGKPPGTRTRNPWNVRQGSSGSSAGSASASAAGCVGFAIGTETLGSISSPCTRCGATGLRPSFGLVPRTGAMALSWSMDKIGPIARSVEDCILILTAIAGPDGRDRACQPAHIHWDAGFDWRKLRIGYLKSAFTPAEPTPATATETRSGKDLEDFNQRMRSDYLRESYDLKLASHALDVLRDKMAVKLLPVDLPQGFHFGDQVPLLGAEGAAAFDELTLSGRDQLLAGQSSFDWPNFFRRTRFYSAVDYIQAQRARTLTIEAMARLFATVDVIVTPSNGAQLTATNLSGHPAIIVPNGIRGDDAPKPVNEEDGALQNVGGTGTPVSLTFLGALYSDARLAAFARAYQEASGFHRVHPQIA